MGFPKGKKQTDWMDGWRDRWTDQRIGWMDDDFGGMTGMTWHENFNTFQDLSSS